MLTIQGSERFTGSVFNRRIRSRRSSFASRSPWVRKIAVSWPPMETTGTIGPGLKGQLDEALSTRKINPVRLPAGAVHLPVAARIDQDRRPAVQGPARVLV